MTRQDGERRAGAASGDRHATHTPQPTPRVRHAAPLRVTVLRGSALVGPSRALAQRQSVRLSVRAEHEVPRKPKGRRAMAQDVDRPRAPPADRACHQEDGSRGARWGHQRKRTGDP